MMKQRSTAGMAFTLRDIAALSGYSIATVSRVLSGKPGVNKDTREKILSLAKSLDFKVNYNARSIKTHRTRTIGLVVADITNQFYSEIAKTIEFQARHLDYTVIVGNTGNNTKEELSIIEAFQERQVDGFIFASAEINDRGIINLIEQGIPTILYHRHLKQGIKHHFVGCDEYKGIALGIEHLASLGHKRVGFICGSKDFSTGIERMKAFMKFRSEYGLEGNNNLIKEGGYDIAKTNRSVHELMSIPDPPTAIFAANDLMALQVMDKVIEMGYRVPEDVSVLGFDNIPIASHQRINLTTVDIQINRGARETVLNLINLIEGIGTAKDLVNVILEPSLVVRTSTASR
jgi:DNA-binding LacI/PurR family transcriptional regulator